MSSLLTGPNALQPWIEKAACEAIHKGSKNHPLRPRMGQITTLGHPCPPDQLPHYVRISDGKDHIVVALKSRENKHFPTCGCLVHLEGLRVTTTQLLVQHEGFVRSELAATKEPLCMVADRMRTIGGHGLAVVGDPQAIQLSVEVRRVLEAYHLTSPDQLTARLAPTQHAPVASAEEEAPQQQQPDPLVRIHQAQTKPKKASSAAALLQSVNPHERATTAQLHSLYARVNKAKRQVQSTTASTNVDEPNLSPIQVPLASQPDVPNLSALLGSPAQPSDDDDDFPVLETQLPLEPLPRTIVPTRPRKRPPFVSNVERLLTAFRPTNKKRTRETVMGGDVLRRMLLVDTPAPH